MILICKETIKGIPGEEILFTKNAKYEFVEVDNKYTKRNNFVGYFVRDDENNKRWCSKKFKEEYFIESN